MGREKRRKLYYLLRVESHSLRKEAALKSGDTSASLARRQQGEQTVAWVGFVF